MSNNEDGVTVLKDGEGATPLECGYSNGGRENRISNAIEHELTTAQKGGGLLSAFSSKLMLRLAGEGSTAHNCTVSEILLAGSCLGLREGCNHRGHQVTERELKCHRFASGADS
jgi:hypothetical protein